MAIIHDSKGMVSEQELTVLEKQLGINFPGDYRDFLKKITAAIQNQMVLVLPMVKMDQA